MVKLNFTTLYPNTVLCFGENVHNTNFRAILNNMANGKVIPNRIFSVSLEPQ